jgi:hypothetical protein
MTSGTAGLIQRLICPGAQCGRNAPTTSIAIKVRQETERLRRQAADLSDMVAQTEEDVADTLEQVAKTRPPADAQRFAGAC